MFGSRTTWIDNLTKSSSAAVCISQGALLLCGNHDYTKATFDLMTGPILLEDGVWVGAKSAVMPGVMPIPCRAHSRQHGDFRPRPVYHLPGCPAQAVKPEPSHRKARSPLPAPPSTYAILRRVYALLNQQERKRSVFLLLSIFTNSIVEILGLRSSSR